MVQTKAGDTLAKIIAANMGAHPYDAKKLHQAIAAMNPQAFLKGNPNRLVAGSVIRLPSPGELHAVMSGQMTAMPMAAPMQMQPMHTPNMAPMPHTASAPMRYGNGMGTPSNAPTGAEDFERHRGWVRFPR
jgi:pilus assembly protein FimV